MRETSLVGLRMWGGGMVEERGRVEGERDFPLQKLEDSVLWLMPTKSTSGNLVNPGNPTSAFNYSIFGNEIGNTGLGGIQTKT